MWHRLARQRSSVALAAVVTMALASAGGWATPKAEQAPATPFAALVQKLSEPGGYFGGDNLISNEQSYLRVMPALEDARLSGGVYLGVGPDQNFSYIAAVRPAIAFMIDLRRDNLLLHLLFKSIFSMAPTRSAYLRLLTGRAPPDAADPLREAAIGPLVADAERAPVMSAAALAALRGRIDAALARTGVPLTAGDRQTLHRFHQSFINAGFDLVFQAHGQPPRRYYPSWRDLLLETDTKGRPSGYLSTDAAYQTVRSLQARDRIVPVVGDVAGPKAMRAIAAEIAERHLTLCAFYISNVEFYLFGDGRFGAFAANLARLPRADRSLMIRSVFPGGFRGPLPQSAPGHYSTSLTQPIDQMLADTTAGRYRGYYDLITASVR